MSKRKRPRGGNTTYKDRESIKDTRVASSSSSKSYGQKTNTSDSKGSTSASTVGEEGNSKSEDRSGPPPITGRAGVRSPTNDPAWYSADIRLLIDSASLPFANPLGDYVNLKGGRSGAIATPLASDSIKLNMLPDVTKRAYPGICTQWVIPSLGGAIDIKDPANICASAFYTHVRYMNSGRKNYEMADLMIYALTIAELYSYIGYVQRVYQYAFMYSQRNKYVAKGLLKASGVNDADIVNNLANLRYWLNAFINKVSSFVIPSDINLFKRKAFMYTGLYIENNEGNIKDQLYQFAPAAFYKFALDEDGKGMLEISKFFDPTLVGESLKTYADLVAYGESLLAPIFADEDFGLISGDVLKAYGSNIIGLAQIPEDAGIVPTYDPWVLSQMHNANIFRPNMYNMGDSIIFYRVGEESEFGKGRKYCNNIYQLDNGNLCNITYIATAPNALTDSDCIKMAIANFDTVLDLSNPQPTPPEIMEATRLKTVKNDILRDKAEIEFGYPLSASSEQTVTKSGIAVLSSGTEIVICESLTRYVDGTQIEQTKYSTNGIAWSTPVQSVVDNTAFKFNAIKYSFALTGSNDTDRSVLDAIIASNLDNYTLVDEHNMLKLHETALLSLFYVPGVAKLIN